MGQQRTLTDRIASQFMVMDGELRPLLHFVAVFALIGGGMALGRGASHALFLKRYGVEYLPFMYLVLGALLFVVSTFYAAFSDRLAPEKMFSRLFWALSVLLIANWALIMLTDITAAYPLFFLLFEVASEILLIHAALYMGQNFDTQQIKRLSPIIFAGMQIGTIAGGLILASATFWVSIEHMLLAWTVVILLTIPVLKRYHLRHGISPYFRHSRHSKARFQQSIDQVAQGFSFMAHSSLLRVGSGALFFMVVTYYISSYAVNLVYTRTFSGEAELTAFFGFLTAITSAIALLIQIFFTNKLIWFLGVKKVNLIYPLTTLAALGGMLTSLAFPLAFFASVNKDSIMPAIRMPVRNLFFNALPQYMQGRARAMSLAIVLPLALAATGVLLIATARLDNPSLFLGLGIGAAVLYLLFSMGMNKAYVRTIVATLKDSVHLPDQNAAGMNAGDRDLLEEIHRGIQHHDDEISLAYARLLIENAPSECGEYIFPRFIEAGDRATDQIVKLIADAGPDGLDQFLLERLASGDAHLRATSMKALVGREIIEVLPAVREYSRSDNPRLRVAALYGILKLDDEHRADEARREWREMMASQDPFSCIVALELLALMPEPEFESELCTLLEHTNPRVISAALQVLWQWPYRIDHLAKLIAPHAHNEDSNIRLLAMQCVSRLSDADRKLIAMPSIEDNHPGVREAAVQALFAQAGDASGSIETMIVEGAVSPRAQMALMKELFRHDPPQFLIEGLVRVKVRDARAVSRVYKWLEFLRRNGESGEAVRLLAMVLEERIQQIVDLVLEAVQRIADAETVSIVRSGLKSADTRLIANATEALRNISNRTLARQIGRVIDIVVHMDSDEDDAVEQYGKIDELLDWCAARHDPWLGDCAGYARKSLGLAT